MAAMQLMYDFIRTLLIYFISSRAVSCVDLPSNDQYPGETQPLETNTNATCLSCENPSSTCGKYGGSCEPLSWETNCHFFEESLCPDGNCGCCIMCHGSCGNNGSCRRCCNAGEVEIKGENCCKGSKYGCKCCVSAAKSQKGAASSLPASKKVEDCKYLLDHGDTKSGVRTISLNDDANTKLEVFCDQDTDNGGWTVIQKRINLPERIDFHRDWISYENGFGNKNEEYWLGNKFISYLTLSANQELRIDLTSFKRKTVFAKYGSFKVGDNSTQYTLHLASFSGTAGDSFEYNNGMKFSTKDVDNDFSSAHAFCANQHQSGWWHKYCTHTNLNGVGYSSSVFTEPSIFWYLFNGSNSVANVTMMIRTT